MRTINSGWLLLASMLAAAAGSAGCHQNCSGAFHHRAKLIREQQRNPLGSDSNDAADEAIEVAMHNEIDLCERADPPKEYFRCYLDVTSEDLAKDSFVFEHRCDAKYRHPKK